MDTNEKPLFPKGKIKTSVEKPVTVTLDNGEVVEMLPNPLPVPKKRVRTGMDYPREIDVSKMEFDHVIPDDKMHYDVE